MTWPLFSVSMMTQRIWKLPVQKCLLSSPSWTDWNKDRSIPALLNQEMNQTQTVFITIFHNDYFYIALLHNNWWLTSCCVLQSISNKKHSTTSLTHSKTRKYMKLTQRCYQAVLHRRVLPVPLFYGYDSDEAVMIVSSLTDWIYWLFGRHTGSSSASCTVKAQLGVP